MMARRKKERMEEGKDISYDTLGRPLVLSKYPNLNHAIMDVLEPDAQASHRRRRNEYDVINQTQLKEQLRLQATIVIGR
jgi:hypothetical protein